MSNRISEVQRARHAAVTECPAGHQYTEANTRLKKHGKYLTRQCKTCHRDRQRHRRLVDALGYDPQLLEDLDEPA